MSNPKDEQQALYCIEMPYQKPELYWYWLICQNSEIPKKSDRKLYIRAAFNN